jgi:hypothetical protein
VFPRKLTRLSCKPRKLAPGVSAMYGMSKLAQDLRERVAAECGLDVLLVNRRRVVHALFSHSPPKRFALYRVTGAATMQRAAIMPA